MRKSNFLLVTVVVTAAITLAITMAFSLNTVIIGQAFAPIPPITLGNPYFVEYDKTTSQKPIVINGTTNATEITFAGHGSAKDVNFTDNGNILIIPRGGSAVLLQGKDNLVSSGGDKASVNIKELGHVDATGMLKGDGAAFYDANATGKFAYLGNTVSIYTDEVDKSGNGKVFAWEWNK